LSTFWPNIQQLDLDRFVNISYDSLLDDAELMTKLENFPQKLKTTPELVLTSAALAMHELVHTRLQDNADKMNLEKYRINLLNHNPVLSLSKGLTRLNYQYLITIRGTSKHS